MDLAIAYVRVSTQEQALEGVSLAAQEERTKAYCSLSGLTLVDVIREEGVSGGVPLAERPGGRKLLESAKENSVKHIVAMKLDRLFRDAVDALTMTRQWDKQEIALHLIDMGGQSLSTGSAMGRFFLSMMASFAELEKNLVSERTRMALAHKKKMRQVYSPTPFGFDRHGDVLKPNESEQEVLRLIRQFEDDDWSLAGIARELNHRGIPTKRGAKWYPSTVRYLLRNELHKTA